MNSKGSLSSVWSKASLVLLALFCLCSSMSLFLPSAFFHLTFLLAIGYRRPSSSIALPGSSVLKQHQEQCSRAVQLWLHIGETRPLHEAFWSRTSGGRPGLPPETPRESSVSPSGRPSSAHETNELGRPRSLSFF